jgi:hypothetical protein
MWAGHSQAPGSGRGLVVMVDSSCDVGASLYHGALSLVEAALGGLEAAAQLSLSHIGARAALVTHMTLGFWPGVGGSPVHQAFHLTSYGHQPQMTSQVHEAASHLLQGAPALGRALEWTLEKVLLPTPLPQRARVLFAIVASGTSSWDREKLWTGLCLRRPSARASPCLCWPWAQA